MGLIADINKKYRENPLHGIQFSIEETAYDCNENVNFGESEQWLESGILINTQDVFLNGENIGWLKERQQTNFFHPITVSFYVPLDKPTYADKINPHYHEGEYDFMRFATLQQMVDYVKTKAV